MDFQSTSKLNTWMNRFSGNLLPLTTDDSFSFVWKLWSGISWLFTLTHWVALTLGYFFMPREKILMDGMISIVIIIEVSVIILRIHTQKTLVQKLIRELNEKLSVQDEIMQDVLTTTLKSKKLPLQFYSIAGLLGVFVWCCVPLPSILHKNTFYYVDLQSPVVYHKEPFSNVTFLLIVIKTLFNNLYCYTKKIAVDLYMTHLVQLITVQHLYTSRKLVLIFREGNQRNNPNIRHKDYYSKTNHMEAELKKLCRHHISAINLTLMLKKLLSLNFSLIYLSNVFRISFLIIMISIYSSSIWSCHEGGFSCLIEELAACIFTCGEIVQLYILCACVHELLEASTNITDEAFHENWSSLEPRVKRMFMLIKMASNVDFNLATFRRFDLSLPSFTAILNQSYSIALLILKVLRK